MEYKLVICKNDFVLEREVNELLKEGWKCQGGVSISLQKGEFTQKENIIKNYTQAMVKE